MQLSGREIKYIVLVILSKFQIVQIFPFERREREFAMAKQLQINQEYYFVALIENVIFKRIFKGYRSDLQLQLDYGVVVEEVILSFYCFLLCTRCLLLPSFPRLVLIWVFWTSNNHVVLYSFRQGINFTSFLDHVALACVYNLKLSVPKFM